MRGRDIVREECERLGRHAVKLKIETGGYPQDLVQYAAEWLAKKAEEGDVEEIAWKKAELAVAQSAADAAWESARAARTANRISTLAIVLSVIAILVSVIAIYAQLAE